METSKTGKERGEERLEECVFVINSGQESLAEKMLLGKDVILEAGSEP